ncbi:DUF4954 family protein [Treponema sp.]
MKETFLIPSDRYGYDFIPKNYIPEGKDEYWQRNRQAFAEKRSWRRLKSTEIEVLVKNDNACSNWDDFLVSDPFDPSLIRNSSFYGLVRIGSLRDILLQHHDFRVQAGIRNSTIISCDIGDDCSIQDCSYLSHYIIGNVVILSRVDEMQCTNHAKFGNGVVMDGEDESVRVWIDVMNEAGGRSILAFQDMICADAYLWAAYRDDTALLEKLSQITQKQYGSKRGMYGQVGSYSVVKSVNIIKDVAIGECAYVKGANKLKNLSICSSEAEPTQIGEGVELVNGIIGYGCRIFYGSKAVRFVMGRNSNLKYGARLIHSVLGDNSTVSCCEMLNNLIYPAHEQHHNNSFLIASLVQGLSNMAAGATVGSNHNSRANDGEIRAARGFWPGLCVTLKHSSRFASYVLIAKGDYPYELDIKFPFSLVNNDLAHDRLEVMPAYFWMYNMYALERNAWKTSARDTRTIKVQRIETDYLAPDTAEEIMTAMALLEEWTGAALQRKGILSTPLSRVELQDAGRSFLSDSVDHLSDIEVLGSGIERRARPSIILKPRRAWRAYRHMLHYYAACSLLEYAEQGEPRSFLDFAGELESKQAREQTWVNLGGQIAPASRVDELRTRIGSGGIDTWDAIHAEYEKMASAYPQDKARHAWAIAKHLYEGRPWDKEAFKDLLEQAIQTREWIENQVFHSRAKDYRDTFRAATYRNPEEMKAVIGQAENNSFVLHARKETKALKERLGRAFSLLALGL